MKIQLPKWLKYPLTAIGAYLLWVVAGIILVETGTAKEFPLGFGGVIVDEHHDLDASTAGIDGPHIFYRGDTIYVKRVIQVDTQFVGSIDTFYSRTDIGLLHIHLSNADTGFSTPLIDSLATAPCIFPEPVAVLTISDIEGNFESFKNLLIVNKVMDREYNWTFGNKHLVLLGDFFDRGLYVTECLWLIYALEQKAARAGGRVHFILGNHEIMNMSDNLKYVRNKYIENTFLIKENYKKWYKPDTELGRWLQTKNIVEKIGDRLYVHGGISEEITRLQLSIEDMNRLARGYYFSTEKALQSSDEHLKTLFDSKQSPFWYRGYVKEETTESSIEKMLNFYNVRSVVIGHTIVPHIKSLFNNKVIAIDTKHSEGINEGLYRENGMDYKVDLSGEKSAVTE